MCREALDPLSRQTSATWLGHRRPRRQRGHHPAGRRHCRRGTVRRSCSTQASASRSSPGGRATRRLGAECRRFECPREPFDVLVRGLTSGFQEMYRTRSGGPSGAVHPLVHLLVQPIRVKPDLDTSAAPRVHLASLLSTRDRLSRSRAVRFSWDSARYRKGQEHRPDDAEPDRPEIPEHDERDCAVGELHAAAAVEPGIGGMPSRPQPDPSPKRSSVGTVGAYAWREACQG